MTMHPQQTKHEEPSGAVALVDPRRAATRTKAFAARLGPISGRRSSFVPCSATPAGRKRRATPVARTASEELIRAKVNWTEDAASAHSGVDDRSSARDDLDSYAVKR